MLTLFSANFPLTFVTLHEKNGFAELSKNLLDTDVKIILLDYQNNYIL